MRRNERHEEKADWMGTWVLPLAPEQHAENLDNLGVLCVPTVMLQERLILSMASLYE